MSHLHEHEGNPQDNSPKCDDLVDKVKTFHQHEASTTKGAEVSFHERMLVRQFFMNNNFGPFLKIMQENGYEKRSFRRYHKIFFNLDRI